MPSKKVAYKNSSQISGILKSTPVTIVTIPDCFTERVILERLSGGYTKIQAEQLTTMWIEDNILSPGLFGNIGPVIVLNSEKINKKVLDFIVEMTLPSDTVLKFFCVKKITHKPFLKMIEQVVLEAPKFWSMGEYIDFFADHFQLKIDSSIKSYLMGILPSSAEAYFNCLMILSAYKETGIDLNVVKGLFKQSSLDNFALADLFNAGNVKKVFINLLIVENDYEAYRSFFSFIQGHILKILDPSYTKQKTKVSKYDQGIIAASNRWHRDELVSILESFSNYEILAKRKSSGLRDEIRLEYLRS